MTNTYHGFPIMVALALILLRPSLAYAGVPTITKTAAVGDDSVTTVYVEPASDVMIRIECGLPSDIDDLESCRYAITDNLPPWLTIDPESVSVTLETPGGNMYDLTDSFDVYIASGSLRAQTDVLREQLPAALIENSHIVLEYVARVSQDLSELTTTSSGAHLTMTPNAGSAKTEASEESSITFSMLGHRIALQVHLQDEAQNPCPDVRMKLSSDGLDRAATTNAQGDATFADIAAGSYDLTVAGSNDLTSVTVSLDDGILDLAIAGTSASDAYVAADSLTCGFVLTMGHLPPFDAQRMPTILWCIAGMVLAVAALGLTLPVLRKAPNK